MSRREMSAAELNELHERIDRQLNRIGVETQPKVALRVLELAQDPGVQLLDWADAVRADWALTGRILRLANSAFYAQRAPVTRLERALVLLGTERTKAVCLGFYLSRAASTPEVRELSRKVWTQAIYRASLAAALARARAPAFAGEAFVVGLMLDCAIPLMGRLLGEEYLGLVEACDSPTKLFAAEFERLEFTHTDVAATLAKRWKLPTLLARPIVWHHAPPPTGHADDSVSTLQRIAYYAGAVRLSTDGMPRTERPLPAMAGRLFEIPQDELSRVVAGAAQEYQATLSIFAHLGDGINSLDALTDSVQVQLVEMMDEQMERALRLETKGGPERLTVAGQSIDVEPGSDGEAVAFITGSNGARLVSCTVRPEKETTDSIRRKLGLDEATDNDMRHLMRVIHAMAA